MQAHRTMANVSNVNSDYYDSAADMDKVARITGKMNCNKFPRTKYEIFKLDKQFKIDLGKVNEADEKIKELQKVVY